MTEVLGRDGNLALDPVLREAQLRFEICANWYAKFRVKFRDDKKFDAADADNGYQWPNDIRTNRDLDDRPCLTVNKTAQHNNLIANDMKMNLPGIKYSPMGNGATAEAAQVWNGFARHIEAQSRAVDIYSHAIDNQVIGGVGYWRIYTDYIDDDSFDQEIYLKQIYDPLTVMIDPDAKEADKSDMRYAFIWEDLPIDLFKQRFPRHKELIRSNGISSIGDWFGKDHVRCCEYYRVVEWEDKLFRIETSSGPQQIFASELDSETLKDVRNRKNTVMRKVRKKTVEWKYIVGNEILDETEWVGSTIPIVQIVGKEVIIDGEYDIKGHTRAMKDPQRMYNYWASAGVEFGALQTKTPWVAPAQAIEGYETYWNNANRQNSSVLAYNGIDDAGNPIPKPERIQPPVSSPVALDGMKISSEELEAVSGQYAAQKGQLGNERSANTLQERQKQSDKANYHYSHNLSVGIRYTGSILLEIIPKIYDTERTIMILGEDGISEEVKIDPSMQQAFMQHQQQLEETVQKVLNPKLGKFQVMANVGPGYATRREEAFEAFKLMLSQNPQLTSIIGDILFRAGDFPLAEEAATRLRRMVPPQALGKGPSDAEQQLQQQLQQVTQVLKNVLDVLAEERLKNKSQASKRDIDGYKALTDRIRALTTLKADGNALDVDELDALAVQVTQESLNNNMGEAENYVKDQLGPKLPAQGDLFGNGGAPQTPPQTVGGM